ncbi:MAG TPA: hypothetical protein VG964_03845 [Candidatus Saccharimonadales bacterium]|nr:hypothetical protein [Candidatus Saccharimonadales bacterium]
MTESGSLPAESFHPEEAENTGSLRANSDGTLGGRIDPTHLRPDEEGYVQDVPTAEEMAYAEKPHRDEAANINDAIQKVESAAEGYAIGDKDGAVFDKSLIDAQARREEASRQFVNEHGDHPGFVLGGSSAKEAFQNATTFGPYRGFELGKMQGVAEEAVAIGEAVAEITRALREHPPSQAFKDTYPDVLIESADQVFELSERGEEIEGEAEVLQAWYEKEYKKLIEDHDPTGLMLALKLLDGESYHAGVSFSSEELALLHRTRKELDQKDSSTIGDYKDLLKNLFARASEDRIRQAKRLRKIFADINSGKASDPDYGKDEVLAGYEEADRVESEQRQTEGLDPPSY